MEGTIETVNPPLRQWSTYEYRGKDMDQYHGVTIESEGGPNGNGYAWCDDLRWSIDTPEDPPSILPLIFYQNWTAGPPLDLRDGKITFQLGGDKLRLHGGRCYFWVSSSAQGSTRWHYIGSPIDLNTDGWGEILSFTLDCSPALWHRSFSSEPSAAMSLEQTLSATEAYGFSFVDFSEKVTGKLLLGKFSLEPKNLPAWPFAGDFKSMNSEWQTVSRHLSRQTSMRRGYVTKQRGNAIIDRMPMVCVEGDFHRIRNDPPYAYLAFIHTGLSTHGMDIGDALLITGCCSLDLDLKDGRIHFFIENSASGTRWIYNVPIGHEVTHLLLKTDTFYWRRISGNASLETVLGGEKAINGYDYIGLMVIDCRDHPTGGWGMYYFSIGPKIMP